MKPSALVTVFDLYPGVVVKAQYVPGRVTVLYQMPGGAKVRASVVVADVKERKK